MKQIYLITLLCLQPLVSGVCSLHAQAYQPMPAGPARWDISRCWYFYPGGWFDRYYVEMDGADTLMFGKTYKKLFHTTHHLPGTEFDSTYTHFLGGIREENRQVFMVSPYLCLDTIERMIYDFRPVVTGDTIRTQILTNGLLDFIPQIVTSVDEIMVDGLMRRRIHLRDEQGIFADAWVEGIGSMRGLPYATYWALTDNSYDLTCQYTDGNLRFRNETPAFEFCTPPFPDSECDPVITSPGEDPKDIRYVLYPNPAGDLLYISGNAEFTAIEVYNTIGQQLMELSFAPEIAVDGLAAGMYIIRLQTREGWVSPAEKFIKL